MTQELNEVLYFLCLFCRCRAPIASLDCMEEFSGAGGHLDFGRFSQLIFRHISQINHFPDCFTFRAIDKPWI